MTARCAVGLPNVGFFGDVDVLVELAVEAERHGWDGVHLWDHLLFDEPGWPVVSPVVAASAIAARTRRARIILTTTLPRRQVQDVAQDAAAIDALSGRRLTLVPVLGSVDREYSEFGLDPDLRARGRALDERLARLAELWAGGGGPPGPVWGGGGRSGECRRCRSGAAGAGRAGPGYAGLPASRAPCLSSRGPRAAVCRWGRSRKRRRSSAGWRRARWTSPSRGPPRARRTPTASPATRGPG